jgi:hypothetical protein
MKKQGKWNTNKKKAKKIEKNKRNKAVVIIIKKSDENWISHTQQGAK